MKTGFLVLSVALLSGCWDTNHGPLQGTETAPPEDFSFLGTTSACYLELPSVPRSMRVNCFHVDGTLHIHSNRFAAVPRLRGESWVNVVRRDPNVRVAINDQIYAMQATEYADEAQRVELLHDRGYSYAWDGIRVFRFETADVPHVDARPAAGHNPGSSRH